jgi:large subunit ribosomal protein L29
MARSSEIRDMTTPEIHTKLDEAREELFNLRFQRAAGQLKDYSRVQVVKRDIARYMTVLSERRILEEWEAAVAAAGVVPATSGGRRMTDDDAVSIVEDEEETA